MVNVVVYEYFWKGSVYIPTVSVIFCSYEILGRQISRSDYLRTNSELGISLGQTHNLELGQIPNSILV